MGIRQRVLNFLTGISSIAFVFGFLSVVISQVAIADALIIQCPGGAPFVKLGDTARQQVTASGGNGSPLTFFLSTSNLDYATVNPSSGLVTYVGAWNDYGLTCDDIGVTDGIDTSLCTVCFMVGGGSTFKVVIENVNNVAQGSTASFRLFLTRSDFQEGLGGFDLLVSLDPSVLSFLSADPGSVYDSCGWEYFSYRLEEPCVGCPTGLVHLYGFAETNPLTPHPTCGWPRFEAHLPVTLATLQVRVALNSDYDCAFVPIRFFWTGCVDNAVWTHDRGYMTLASKIFDYGNPNEIQDPQAGFPGYVGPTFDCDIFSDTLVRTRDLELRNGGLDILCVDPIGQRGDINANRYPYEIADAVMFTEYFMTGLGAFGAHITASMAASDINGDGAELTLPDLVCLIRVVLGDQPPIPKPVAIQPATIANKDGVISVTNSPKLGAAFFTFNGNVEVTPLPADIRVSRRFDGEFTKVLLTIPFDENASATGFSGDLLRAEVAEIVSAELVDFDGNPLKTTLESSLGFVVEPMYPNPFNPSATFRFSLPVESDYELSVYNMLGQKALNFTGHVLPNAGVALDINMFGKSSGIYLFKFTAGEFSYKWKGMLIK